MSDSNIGGRKGKSPRNHILIINGIIYDVLNNKNKPPVLLQFYDYKTMFDSMSVSETISGMYDIGVQNENLVLLLKSNKNIKMAIKTQDGLTKRTEITSSILQGDSWGPIYASVEGDQIGKEALEAGHSYLYKGKLEIGPLGLIDDIMGATEAGYQAHMLNSFINFKSAEKKLQFGFKKCQYMIIGKKVENNLKNPLQVDCWKTNYVHISNSSKDGIIFCNIEYSKCCFGENVNCCEKALKCCDIDQKICCDRKSRSDFTCCDTYGISCENILTEKYDGKFNMQYSTNYKYLGHYISNENNNMTHINKMVEKSRTIKMRIFNCLQQLKFGKYFFEVGIILMKSILRPSILYSIETCYNLTENEMRKLEQVEEDFLVQLAKTKKTCPKSQLYLEFGIYPCRFEVMKLRILFYYTIMNEEKNSLLYNFLNLQKQSPVRNDWYSEVRKNMKYLELHLSDDQIQSISKWKLKSMLNKCIDIQALKYILEKRKSKGSECTYKNLATADYFMPSHHKFTIMDKRKIFEVRN